MVKNYLPSDIGSNRHPAPGVRTISRQRTAWKKTKMTGWVEGGEEEVRRKGGGGVVFQRCRQNRARNA